MIILARRAEDGETVQITGVRKMERLRTDLAQASKRAGWLLTDDSGLSMLFDDLMKIISIKEET